MEIPQSAQSERAKLLGAGQCTEQDMVDWAMDDIDHLSPEGQEYYLKLLGALGKSSQPLLDVVMHVLRSSEEHLYPYLVDAAMNLFVGHVHESQEKAVAIIDFALASKVQSIQDSMTRALIDIFSQGPNDTTT